MPYTYSECRPLAFEVLVELVRQNLDSARPHKITYKNMADAITRKLARSGTNVFHRAVANIVGTMMDDIWEKFEDAPPINAFVVNKDTQMPGFNVQYHFDAYFHQDWGWYDALSDVEKMRRLQTVWNDACKYREWDEIAAWYRASHGVHTFLKDKGVDEEDGKARRIYGVGPAEGLRHKQLKLYIQAHPKLVGAPSDPDSADVEHQFESLDEADVLFTDDQGLIVVEVKSNISNQQDMRRGLFQCVKYRALAEAEELVSAEEEDAARAVAAVLVIETGRRIPASLRADAKTVGVKIVEIDPEKIDRWAKKNRELIEA